MSDQNINQALKSVLNYLIGIHITLFAPCLLINISARARGLIGALTDASIRSN